MLGAVDLGIIAAYLLGALLVGFWVRERAGRDRVTYFLAGRNLPWWWAGISIAATTFAADTPLAVVGIIADRGLSGNWMWLSWVAVHAGVVVYFAARWSRLGVVTDAELVASRYEGRAAEFLRLFRAGLYGLVYNAIILGWVLRAMVKVAAPFFHWGSWAPGLVSAVALLWPDGGGLGTAEEGLTVLVLLFIVIVYASAGGLAGVVITDLFQFALAISASVAFAWVSMEAVGGGEGLRHSLASLYGEGHHYLELWPGGAGGWAEKAGLGAFGLGLYLVVQSVSNTPADGGGYLMQRLNATRSPQEARRAALLFVVLQYLLRVWPWFIVGLVALVLIPIGRETTVAIEGAAIVAADRETAYPVLMGHLLPPGMLGLMAASLLAAFMSTVDTHLNWGASYVVNDVLPQLGREFSERQRVLIARLAVLGYGGVAVFVCSRIESIELAWQLIAALGAALGPVTALRWLWWRITAWVELGSSAVGLATALTLAHLTDVPYESRLILTAFAAALALFGLVWLTPRADRGRARAFADRTGALGFWPDRPLSVALGQLGRCGAELTCLLGLVFAGLWFGHRAFILGDLGLGMFGLIACLVVLARSMGLRFRSG